jgi:hypothetical protein
MCAIPSQAPPSDIEIMRNYLNRTYACKGQRGSLLPFVMQILHNNYAGVIKKVSFILEDNLPMMIFCDESLAEYKVRLGFCKPQESQLAFQNESYTVSTQSEFKQDEDDNWVLKCKINFIETPHTRLVKCFFIGDNKMILKLNEAPSARFSLESFGVIDALPFVRNELMHDKFYKLLEPVIEMKKVSSVFT